MEKIILKLHDQWHKLDCGIGQSISLGRALDNDVIVDDVYVAAHQLSFYKQQEQWFLKRESTTNPLRLNKKLQKTETLALSSGDKLLIGRTSIEFYDQSHRVADEKILSTASWLHNQHFKFIYLALAMCLFVALTLLEEWSQTYVEFKLKDQVVPVITMLALVLCWSLFWAFIGKLLSSKSYFLSHLFFTLLAVSLDTVMAEVQGIFEYYFNIGPSISTLISQVIGVTIYGVLIGLHLNLVSDMRYYFKKAFALCGALVLSFYAYEKIAEPDYYLDMPYADNVQIPLLLNNSQIEVEEFIQNYDQLFEENDAMRKEKLKEKEQNKVKSQHKQPEQINDAQTNNTQPDEESFEQDSAIDDAIETQ